MNVLGIETSCDETAAAVVSCGLVVRSNVVFSQTDLHRPYGGVVPEVASRNHSAYLPGIAEKAVSLSGLAWAQMDAVAATYGPGLASSLLVGLAFGKALAIVLRIPFVAVNHLEAHLYAPFMSPGAPDFAASCPLVALVVSGGHTCLIRADAPGKYRLLGTTVDDAAGEIFDKGAKLLGLPYPGGPEISRLAEGGDPGAIAFPRGRLSADTVGGLRAGLCFSFSGLKTSLLYCLKRGGGAKENCSRADIAASYQEAIVDSLCARLELAASVEGVRCVAVGGGVSLNRRLREKIVAMADKNGLKALFSAPEFCMDNAAMVAGVAGCGLGLRGRVAWEIDARPNFDPDFFK